MEIQVYKEQTENKDFKDQPVTQDKLVIVVSQEFLVTLDKLELLVLKEAKVQAGQKVFLDQGEPMDYPAQQVLKVKEVNQDHQVILDNRDSLDKGAMLGNQDRKDHRARKDHEGKLEILVAKGVREAPDR